MTTTQRTIAALYADAALHEQIADEFSGTGEPYFEALTAGHLASATLAYRQADRLTLTQRVTQ